MKHLATAQRWGRFSVKLCSCELWRAPGWQEGEVTAMFPTAMFQGGIIWCVWNVKTTKQTITPRTIREGRGLIRVDVLWVISVQFTVVQVLLLLLYYYIVVLLYAVFSFIFKWSERWMLIHFKKYNTIGNVLLLINDAGTLLTNQQKIQLSYTGTV